MFQDLDDTLTKILVDPQAPAELHSAEVSFETPEKTYTPTLATMNLFLYEVKENRELRDPVPLTTKSGDIYVQRKPPLRVDCSYVVTAWADPNIGKVQQVRLAHQLLSQAFLWLIRFPTIPSGYWQGSLSNPPQAFPPPTMVAQMDGSKEVGEFWSALGIPPRPYFKLVVTIAMDLNQQIEGPLVTTTITGYRQDDNADAHEERINIGGLVRDRAGNPVPQAWVSLEPTGAIQTTDEEGRFIFRMVRRGTGYALRARAPGFPVEAVHTPLEIPSLSGEYNLQFP